MGKLPILELGQLTWVSLLTPPWLSLVLLFQVNFTPLSYLLFYLFFLPDGGILYVARSSVIELYNVNTNVKIGSWPATNAGQLALDASGNLWVSPWSAGSILIY